MRVPDDFDSRQAAVVDPQRRLGMLFVLFALGIVAVAVRLTWLLATDGPAYRAAANRPLEQRLDVPGTRGRILARDGTVLAEDRPRAALAVHYRYLETPPDARWLRNMARSRLTAEQRRDTAQRAEAEVAIGRERAALRRQLAELAGLSQAEFDARAQLVQLRVEAIREQVNRRHRERFAGAPHRAAPAAVDSGASWWRRWIAHIRAAWAESPAPAAPAPITVAEELDYHIVSRDLELEAVAEIEGQPARYSAARIVLEPRRHYPRGTLAAHAIGHLGPVTAEELAEHAASTASTAAAATVTPAAGADAPVGGPRASDVAYDRRDLVGRTGIEHQYEWLLRGARGVLVEQTDRSGRALGRRVRREPTVGRDITLTIDARLQATAESLLDAALVRRLPASPATHDDQVGRAAGGGAIVVLDVHSGAVLASASAPRFDPGWFAPGESAARTELFAHGDHPLLDRATQMALPPGSVFKVVSAIALLAEGTIDATTTVDCRGYLDQPDRHRCQRFVRFGLGHGPVKLTDALAQSCNVFFFQGAERMGPEPLVAWAQRLGLGQPTGIDLPAEAAGHVPAPSTSGQLVGRAWQRADTLALSIGQSRLTVTPLQAARLMAAVANGGWLVTPHLYWQGALPLESSSGETTVDPVAAGLASPRRIEGLSAAILAQVRDGLERVVADDDGTGHATIHVAGLHIAGKTGTAQTGGGRDDHAWFAGYAPAEAPRVAIVVALEHAGSGTAAAGPVVERLSRQLDALGYLVPRRVATREDGAWR